MLMEEGTATKFTGNGFWCLEGWMIHVDSLRQLLNYIIALQACSWEGEMSPCLLVDLVSPDGMNPEAKGAQNWYS